MNLPADFTLEVSGRAVPVTGLNAKGFLVKPQDGLASYKGPVGISLARDGRSWRGDMHVSAENDGADLILALTGSREERLRFLSVLNWYAGRSPSFAYQFADTVPADREAGRMHPRQVAKLVGLGLLAVGLIATISQVLVQRGTSATSRMAYVSVPGAELDANTAGQVVFVKPSGRLEEGEFFAALRTSRDNPKFLEADTSGNVSANAVSSQDYVRKGTPVVRLADNAAIPYVSAFVTLSDAVPALNAAEAWIEFPKSGMRLAVPVDGRRYVNSTRLMTDEDGKPLAEIRLRLPEGAEVPRGEPVVVRFGGPVRGLMNVPQQWLSALSSLLS